jgi:hypothetical protein
MTALMTMIERVARAIAEAQGDEPDGDKDFEREARAAIAAMREPTDRMLAAANWSRDGAGHGGYEAMIDAAKKQL